MVTPKPDAQAGPAWDAGRGARGAGGSADDGHAALLAVLKDIVIEEGPPACIADAQGRMVYANAAFRGIAGALEAAGVDLGAGKVPVPIAAPAGHPPGMSRFGPPGHPIDRDLKVPMDGHTEHFRLRQRTLIGDDGSQLTASVLTPITREKTKGAALATAMERLEDITRLVSDWVWETNRNLVLTFVSPRVNEALGYHQLELTGRMLTDLPVQPSQALEALARPEGRQPFRDVEIEVADRDGNARQFLLSGLPVYCPERGAFLGFRGTARDITDLRSREQATRTAKEAAELANRTKGEFLANMSHELRTPLNAIIGFSDIMSGEILGPLGNEQYRGYAVDIADSARHLLDLINDILDAAKIEAGHMALSEEWLDPARVVGTVRRLVDPRAQRAGILFETDAPPGLPRVFADEVKLKQILINLASNAVKFTLQGGRVEIGARVSEGGEFLFIVSDTGIGMAPEDIPRALAPFGQVDSTLSRRFEGTGLGLPLSKSLTELHGGSFHVVSQPDVGTTVTVRLPAERVRPR